MKRLPQLLAIIVLLAIPLSAAQAYTLGFAPKADYAMGTSPKSVVVEDFNGDGKPDLAVANSSSSSMSVLWNDGDGTFDGSSLLTYAAGMRPLGMAVGDFNGDDKPDLVTANQSSHNVSVRWNDGDGTFDNYYAAYTMGSYPTSVAVGDFNGDSQPDLATANYGSEDVSVRWNDGDGTFDDHLAAYSAGAGANSVAVGDFNGDNWPDLAIANYDGSTLSVRWNDGDGTFDGHNSAYLVSGYPDALTVGDFNGDSWPDLASANDLGYTVSVLWNDGDGTFDDHNVTYSAGSRPNSVALGDFNADGKPDLAISNYSGNNVSVRWNDGDGTFDDLHTVYGVGLYPNSVAAEDLNGDGKPDLVTANDSEVSVLLNALKGDTLTTLTALPASANYGDNLILTATVTADIPGTPTGEVQFKDNGLNLGAPVALTDGQATYNTSALGVGSHSLTAEFLANEDYNGSTSNPQAVTVSKTPLTIQAEDLDKVYGDYWSGFPLIYTGFVDGEDEGVLGGGLIIITSADWDSDAGSYSIRPAGLTSPNYSITFQPGRLHITPAPLTITAENKTKAYGDPNPPFTISYSGFVLGQNESVLGGTLSFITSAAQSSPAGTYPVTPQGLTSTNYGITFADGTLTVVDTANPSITSIQRAAGTANLTNAASVDFTVSFSEPVTDVDTGDFTLHLTGEIINQSITNVVPVDACVASPYCDAYTLTVETGSGNGTLGLDLSATVSITDLAGKPLGDQPFSPDEEYTVQKTLALLTPADGEGILSKRPTFNWSDFPSATKYQIQLSRSSLFDVLDINVAALHSTYTPSADLRANKEYFWRVRAQVNGVWRRWSDVWSFTTGRPPSIPVLVSPATGSLTRNYRPTLDWNNSIVPIGAAAFDHYEIQIDLQTRFTDPVLLDDVTPSGSIGASSYTPGAPLAANTRYFWRVRSVNVSGQYSSWSAVWSFRTALLPPTNLTPGGGAMLGSRKPLLNWQAVDGAEGYQLQISTSDTFATLLVSTPVATNAFTPVTNLPAHTTIYWRVRSTGVNGPSRWTKASFNTP